MIKVAEFVEGILEGLHPTIWNLVQIGVPRDKITITVSGGNEHGFGCKNEIFVDLPQDEWNKLIEEDNSKTGHFGWEFCEICSNKYNDIVRA